MTPVEKQWENLKNDYIRQVKKALSSVKHPRSKEVLEDVRAHLTRRFSELSSEEQTIGNLQTIIIEMGPASDYTDLLEPQIVKHSKKTKKKYFLISGIAAVVIITIAISLIQPQYTKVKADIPSTSTIDKNGRIIDKIDYPFKNDPQAIGAWESVDYVQEIENFKPGIKIFRGNLFLKELFVFEEGKTNRAWKWTKGLFLNPADKTASMYLIKEINGTIYMFFEWKSGDYVFRHLKPSFYVLRKVNKPYVGSRTEDKIDYPFINDPEVIGAWKSVDFVDTQDEFRPSLLQWKGELYLKELVFLPDGKMKNSQDTWTKGLVLNLESKTASRYTIKKINDSTYMFYEWKSGDYTLRGLKPKYYVLKKE